MIVVPAPGAAVAPLQAVWTSGYERSSNGALTWEGTKKLRCLAKVFQCHKYEPEVEFISSNSSSSNKSDSENEDFIICHDKFLLDCYNTIVKKNKKRVYWIAYSSAMQSMHKCTKRCIGNLSEPLLAESELPLQLKFEV